MASGAAGDVGDALSQWMSRRRKVVLIAAITVGTLASVTALVLWESSRECIRSSTRIDMSESGKVRWTRVCAEV